jgi:hypothetical protein
MEGEGYVSLEELNEYNSVANQTFLREKDFYEFYNNYAKYKGFSIRKSKVRYKTGTKEVIWRRYMCSSKGYRSVKYLLTQNLHLAPNTQQAEQADFTREKITRRASQFSLKLTKDKVVKFQSL